MNFNAARFERSYGLGLQLPACEGEEIVLCGRSNVGKSTLINKLCAQKALARVSGTPGKTATINSFILPGGVRLIDLPGYGYAKRPQSELRRWAELLETYFTGGRNISLALVLLDSRRVPSPDDRTMVGHLRDSHTSFAAVMTKIDKLNKTEYAESYSLLSEYCRKNGALELIPFSSGSNDDAVRLRERIAELAGLD